MCSVSRLNRVVRKRHPCNPSLLCRVSKFTQPLMVNGVHESSVICGPICMWTLGCFIFLTLVLQYSLSMTYTYVHSSLHELVFGSSMRRSPTVGFLYVSNNVCLIRLSRPNLRICPNYCSRLSVFLRDCPACYHTHHFRI